MVSKSFQFQISNYLKFSKKPTTDKQDIAGAPLFKKKTSTKAITYDDRPFLKRDA